MAAQRDAQQEREQKLSIIKELMERSAMLDDDWGLRESELEVTLPLTLTIALTLTLALTLTRSALTLTLTRLNIGTHLSGTRSG